MEKDFKKLEDEQVDDEFEKLLQEFIDRIDDDDDDLDDETASDDSDTDVEDTTDGDANDDDHEEESPIRFGGERNYMPEMTKVEIEVQPDIFGSLYLNGDVAVTIHGKKDTAFNINRFQLYIYGEGLYPMANSSFFNERKQPSPSVITTSLMSTRVWVPGNYTLYVRDTSDDSLVRIPFTFDDKLEAKIGQPEPCQICSTDDILTSVVDGNNTYWEPLAKQPGAAQLRRYAVESKQLEVYNDYRQAMHGDPIRSSGHLLITTRNNDFSAEMLHGFQTLVAADYSFRLIDCATLFDASRNNPYENLFDELSFSGHYIFCLTNVGALLSTGGKIIVKKILEKIRSDSRLYLLWLCGCKADIGGVLNMFPSLAEFFPADHRLAQEPYKDFELVQAFFIELRNQGLYCSIDAMDALARTILQGCHHGTLSTWTIEDIRHFVVDQVRPRYLERCFREIQEDRLPHVEIDDLCFDQLTSTEATTEQCYQSLNEMVGLNEVKLGLRQMADNTSFISERRRRGLPTSQKATFHCVFTGNPGTGKTTVAKKLGRIYRSLGLLSKGEVIAVDRTRLVGRYIGETEENMKAILDEARGNVLFIDEAYTLYDGASDRKDFGARVIDSLLTVLSQPDPDMLVIFAGYLKEMDAMLNTNPGLIGRFPYKYQFADYNPDQLFEIACRLLKSDAYVLSPEAEVQLRESITKAYVQRDEHFSNARWVEQFVGNGIIPAMASRISQTACDDYQTIEASDVRQAYAKFNPKATALKPRQKVGFSA